jgi:hypothetical protein
VSKRVLYRFAHTVAPCVRHSFFLDRAYIRCRLLKISMISLPGGATISTCPSVDAEHDQQTMTANDQQNVQAKPLSQGGMIASSSDNVFHPVSNVPSSYVFSLPDVPLNHAYNPPNMSQRPLPYHSPFSSYNNPMFTMPRHNLAPPSSTNAPLGAPPPVLPYIRPQSVHKFTLFRLIILRTCIITLNLFTNFHNLHIISINLFFLRLSINQFITPLFLLYIKTRLYVLLLLPLFFLLLPKTLPTVMHITVLTSKLDFFPWDEGVTSLIQANNLFGHILDPSVYVDPTRPDLAPKPQPVLSTTSSVRDIEASNCWWADDNIAQHILVS